MAGSECDRMQTDAFVPHWDNKLTPAFVHSAFNCPVGWHSKLQCLLVFPTCSIVMGRGIANLGSVRMTIHPCAFFRVVLLRFTPKHTILTTVPPCNPYIAFCDISFWSTVLVVDDTDACPCVRQWYKIFRVNPESVRGLWASQQQELLYFRNGDAERGSIQNAKCVLRNLVSQSCDQPVGYPIFISEIDHSYNSAVPSASAMGGDSVGPLGTLSRWVRRLGGHTLRAFAKKAASNTNDAAVRINVEGEVENARAISTDVEMDTLAAPQDEADVVDTRSLSPESAFAYASRRSILEPEDGSAGNPSHVRDAATLSRGDNGSRDNGMAAETSFTAAVGLQEDGTLSI
eukprot:m.70576 g.70576  ORF g.70576 m.70576 type:complete len:345 (-) comp16051_c0_seq16:2557-3591(-)